VRECEILHNKSCPLYPNVRTSGDFIFPTGACKAIITRSLSKMNAPTVISRVKIAEVIEIYLARGIDDSRIFANATYYGNKFSLRCFFYPPTRAIYDVTALTYSNTESF